MFHQVANIFNKYPSFQPIFSKIVSSNVTLVVCIRSGLSAAWKYSILSLLRLLVCTKQKPEFCMHIACARCF